MTNILIAIPVYNCEVQIVRVLASIEKQISDIFFKIVVIDNGSTDNTISNVISWIQSNNRSDNFVLIQNKINVGLGGSHRVAFSIAEAYKLDGVIILHGDDQADINDILPIILNKKFDPSVSFLGSRFMVESKLLGYSKLRIIGNIVFNKLYTYLSGYHINDLGSGLNYFSIDAIKSCCVNNVPNDLTFNCSMLLNMCYFKSKFTFFPISWRESDQISNVKLFSQSYKILKIIILYFINPKYYLIEKNNYFNKFEYSLLSGRF